MVAVAERAGAAGVARRPGLRWHLGAAAALVVGLGLRLALGGGGVGDRSAALMTAMLCLGAWLATLVLSTPLRAFIVAVGLVGLLDLGALPPRNAPEYDGFSAFFSTDQVLSASIRVGSELADPQAQPRLTLLVQPVFASTESRPSFGLAGQIENAAVRWDCEFRRGIQRLALPVPPGVLPAAGGVASVQLHLTGTPSGERSEYLLVYESSKQAGYLLSLAAASETLQDTPCALL